MSSRPEPPPWGTQTVSYLRDIQPLLNSKCIACHTYEREKNKVILTDDLTNATKFVIPAGKIITAADNNGRMAVIDRWVLEKTLGWIDQNIDRFSATHFICVNLSGSSLNDERFVEDAFSMLSSHPKAASLVCLEVTESVALHDLQNTGRFIDRAKSLGAKIALDDFGAGYSSFSYLRDLPADALKIDGGFVKGVGRGSEIDRWTDCSNGEQLARRMGSPLTGGFQDQVAPHRKTGQSDLGYAALLNHVTRNGNDIAGQA